MNRIAGRNAGRSRSIVRRVIVVLALSIAVMASPALTYAQHGGGFGGGGHVGGGGGHFSGGGGHVPSGGAHFGGGGHFAAGGGHVPMGGAYGGVVRGTGGAYMAPHSSFYGSPRGNYVVSGGARVGTAPHLGGTVHYGGSSPGYVSGWNGGVRPGYGSGFYGGYGHRPYWGGGYWHGVFWPHVYYRTGFAWFLPVLPIGFGTYYWGNVPYYYWDDLYYTWSPSYNGYVVTTPPPVAESAEATTSDGSQSGGSADVYVYPRNGQSDEQTASDRYECHKWAVGQTGFDPTRSSNSSGSASEYRRAMTACLDARGYSAK